MCKLALPTKNIRHHDRLKVTQILFSQVHHEFFHSIRLQWWVCDDGYKDMVKYCAPSWRFANDSWQVWYWIKYNSSLHQSWIFCRLPLLWLVFENDLFRSWLEVTNMKRSHFVLLPLQVLHCIWGWSDWSEWRWSPSTTILVKSNILNMSICIDGYCVWHNLSGSWFENLDLRAGSTLCQDHLDCSIKHIFAMLTIRMMFEVQ